MGNPWTPGPWTIGRSVIRKDGPSGRIRHIVGFLWDDEQGEADHRLISEAPAMAEALEDALFCLESVEKLRNPEWDGFAMPTSTIGTARAILARIKGETP